MGHVTPYSQSNHIKRIGDGLTINGESKINRFSKVPEDRTAVDNILRINHGNQMRLGLMADAKANIMITVSSVVFSVAVANLDNVMMRWPLGIFAFGCFFTLLFAIFAIIPRTDYPKDEYGDIDRASPYFNPLFFGHFAHIDVDEYKEDYAEKLMTDDKIYDALAGDIYGQGKVLALSKYKYLKRSYNCFLGGMAAAILVFFFQESGMFWAELGSDIWDAVIKNAVCNRTPSSRICHL